MEADVVGMTLRLMALQDGHLENQTELPRIAVTLNGINVDALVDSAASRAYIAQELAETAQLRIQSGAEQQRVVALPDGSAMTIQGWTTFGLVIDGYQYSVNATVINMTSAKLILGVEWLQQHRAMVNFLSDELVLLSDDGNQQSIPFLSQASLAQSSFVPDGQSELISALRMQRVLKAQPDEAYMLILRHQPTTEAINSIAEDAHFQDVEDAGLRKILSDFSDVFQTDIPTDEAPEDIPSARQSHSEIIQMDSAPPKNIRSYRLTASQLKEQETQVRSLLSQGLIRESSSPWGFPVLFVPKKDGGYRMCIDYRALNAVTVRNSYPLPRIQDCLDQLGSATVFSKIDLTSGYWQIRMHTSDIPKTAFNTQNGKFEFLVMPFGLKNAPSVFQTIINQVLRDHIGKFVIVYLDDILIYSCLLAEHAEHIRIVLSVLKTHRLYAKPSKCSFMKSEMEFCGHLIKDGCIRPLDSKLKVIRDWPRPTTVHDVRSFLGLCSYYRRYGRSFATVTAPLYSLLSTANLPPDTEGSGNKQTHRINWNHQCTLAFQKVKDMLCSAPILRQPDTSRPFTIETDASDWAIGCVLLQDWQGKLHPVAFDGRKMIDTELRYPVHEKELLAIKHALRTWRHYIVNGHKITVVTDHQSLSCLPTTKIASKRLECWLAEFGEYDLDIRYRKGSENVVADAISRRSDFLGSLTEEPDHLPLIADYLRTNQLPSGELGQEVQEESTHYKLDADGRLLRIVDERGTVAPYTEPLHRQHFLSRMHNSYGHLGSEALLGIVHSRAWWPKINTDLEKFCRTCPACQVSARLRIGQERELAVVMAKSDIQPFERWGIDLIGILPKTPDGNQWIVTAIDYATGWPLAKALPDAKAWRIADFIYDEIYTTFGSPRELLSDNGENLIARVISILLRKMGTRHRLTTAYHPRTNGKVESFNGLLGRTLTKLMVGQPTRLWDTYLRQALFAARIRTHATAGKSPFFLTYGVEPRLPTDEAEPRAIEALVGNAEDQLPELRTQRQTAAQAVHNRAVQAKLISDQKVKPHTLQESEWVLVRHENPYKFEAKWFGPYQIHSRQTLGTYQLKTVDGRLLMALIHGNRLIPAHIREGTDVRQFWNNPWLRQAFQTVETNGVGRVAPSSDEVDADIESTVNAEYGQYPQVSVRQIIQAEHSQNSQGLAPTVPSGTQMQSEPDSSDADVLNPAEDPSRMELEQEPPVLEQLRRSRRQRRPPNSEPVIISEDSTPVGGLRID